MKTFNNYLETSREKRKSDNITFSSINAKKMYNQLGDKEKSLIKKYKNKIMRGRTFMSPKEMTHILIEYGKMDRDTLIKKLKLDWPEE